MKSISSLLVLFALLAVSLAASQWTFEDGAVSIHTKGAGVGGGEKEKITPDKKIPTAIKIGAPDTLKILLTTKEGKQAKRAHQTFLQLKDVDTDLETSFAFQVKESGKAKVDISQKDIPAQLLASSKPLVASIIIGSFGSSKAYFSPAFDVKIDVDPTIKLPPKDFHSAFDKLPNIHHIFKSDPQSPPQIITAVFSLAVIVCLPALVGVWISLGANLDDLSTAIQKAPLPHTLFFLSIVALEGVFFLYYTHWKLFQALPSALGIGLVTFLSGSRALREVQQRRLAGLR